MACPLDLCPAGGSPAPPSDPTGFWTGELADPELAGSVEGTDPDALQEGNGNPALTPTGRAATVPVHLRTLGGSPFWRGAGEPTRVIAEMIQQGRLLGIETLAGPESSAEEEG